jgi:hypothetical protein
MDGSRRRSVKIKEVCLSRGSRERRSRTLGTRSEANAEITTYYHRDGKTNNVVEHADFHPTSENGRNAEDYSGDGKTNVGEDCASYPGDGDRRVQRDPSEHPVLGLWIDSMHLDQLVA